MRLLSPRATSVTGDEISLVITTEISKILLACSFGVNKGLQSASAAIQELRGMLVTLSYFGEGQDNRMFSRVPLGAIIDFEANGEGGITVEQNADGIFTRALVGIPCSVDGSIDFDGDDQYQFVLSGLESALGEDGGISVYGIQTPVYTPAVQVMVHAVVNTDEPEHTFQVGNYDTVLIPVEGIEVVHIRYTSGNTTRLYQDELCYLNGINDDTLVSGYSETGPENRQFHVVNIAGAKEIHVTRSGSGPLNLFLAGPQVVRNPATAVARNSKLVDTVDQAVLQTIKTAN